MAITPQDLGTSLGIIATGILIAGKIGYEWLQRNKVERRRTDSEVKEFELKDHAAEAYQRLIDNAMEQLTVAERRVTDERTARLAAEKRADEAYEQARKDREADRKRIEELSREVHALNLKVNNLTEQNRSLSDKLATFMGGKPD